MVSLRFYGGVGEIGGNKILLEDRDTRIWLDFGKRFNSGNEYYCGYLQPRSVTGLKDYFEFDLMPKVRGLYAKEMLTETEIKYKEPCFDAVVISHSHGDHVGHLEFIDPLLPVYTGTGTKLFMEAAEETSYGWKFGTHDYRSFRTGHHLKIGALEIRPIHVDHSVPGAYGFVIQTSEGAIVYTGDLRAHGPKAAMTEEFLTVASESKPCALIIEGTRMAPVDTRKNLSEAEVRDGVVDICQRPQNRDRLIVYTHGIRDMDRLLTFTRLQLHVGEEL